MQHYEYLVINSSGGLSTIALDAHGKSGWELVSETVVRDVVRAVFKRPIEVEMN